MNNLIYLILIIGIGLVVDGNQEEGDLIQGGQVEIKYIYNQGISILTTNNNNITSIPTYFGIYNSLPNPFNNTRFQDLDITTQGPDNTMPYSSTKDIGFNNWSLSNVIFEIGFRIYLYPPIYQYYFNQLSLLNSSININYNDHSPNLILNGNIILNNSKFGCNDNGNLMDDTPSLSISSIGNLNAYNNSLVCGYNVEYHLQNLNLINSKLLIVNGIIGIGQLDGQSITIDLTNTTMSLPTLNNIILLSLSTTVFTSTLSSNNNINDTIIDLLNNSTLTIKPNNNNTSSSKLQISNNNSTIILKDLNIINFNNSIYKFNNHSTNLQVSSYPSSLSTGIIVFDNITFGLNQSICNIELIGTYVILNTSTFIIYIGDDSGSGAASYYNLTSTRINEFNSTIFIKVDELSVIPTTSIPIMTFTKSSNTTDDEIKRLINLIHSDQYNILNDFNLLYDSNDSTLYITTKPVSSNASILINQFIILYIIIILFIII